MHSRSWHKRLMRNWNWKLGGGGMSKKPASKHSTMVSPVIMLIELRIVRSQNGHVHSKLGRKTAAWCECEEPGTVITYTWDFSGSFLHCPRESMPWLGDLIWWKNSVSCIQPPNDHISLGIILNPLLFFFFWSPHIHYFIDSFSQSLMISSFLAWTFKTCFHLVSRFSSKPSPSLFRVNIWNINLDLLLFLHLIFSGYLLSL